MAKKIIFLFIIVFSHPSHAEIDPSFNDQPKPPEQHHTDWMSQLNDDRLLSEVTIPGAHDAMAFNCIFLAECQAWNLNNQLSAGLRYFDLRVDSSLQLVHGMINLGASLEEVLVTIVNFLQKYKKETVLIRVKPERSWFHRRNTAFNRAMELLKADNINPYVYMSEGNNPKLKVVRGKMVVLRLPQTFDFGITYLNTHNEGEHVVRDITAKKITINKHLFTASKKCNKEVTLTYSSGTGLTASNSICATICERTPKYVAQMINPWLIQRFEDFKNKCLGIIAMDYPGPGLIKEIIKHNLIDENNNQIPGASPNQ